MTRVAPRHYYARDYFRWQGPIGEFGGWANLSKFVEFIPSSARVLDFGCGGGFLLANIVCARKIGVEINTVAAESARQRGIEVFPRTDDVPNESVDVVISNHALEHTVRPLDEVKLLWDTMRPGGTIVFVVPCESIACGYQLNDKNHHLYSWSPMCLGNLFSEAGFEVAESKPYIHKWPPNYRWLARFGGRNLFDIACRLYARIERSTFQVRLIGKKPG